MPVAVYQALGQDLTVVVDGECRAEIEARGANAQVIEVHHDAIAAKEGVGAGLTNDLSGTIYANPGCAGGSGKSAK